MPSIHHLVEIGAPPAAVFQALTEPTGLRAWWTPAAEARPEEGTVASFQFGNRYHDEMLIERLVPDREVMWSCIAGDPEWIDTLIVFLLEPLHDGTGTRVHFRHAGWRAATPFMVSCNTHWGRFMHSLRRYCETGVGDPYPN